MRIQAGLLKMTDDIFEKLAEPFPPHMVHERPGPGGKMMPYINARDVMDRLDEVVHPWNWQDKMTETRSGRVICELSIYVDDIDRWVTKTDGAGETVIEGPKGAISDAFKRAAVKFGIGRLSLRKPRRCLGNEAAANKGLERSTRRRIGE